MLNIIPAETFLACREHFRADCKHTPATVRWQRNVGNVPHGCVCHGCVSHVCVSHPCLSHDCVSHPCVSHGTNDTGVAPRTSLSATCAVPQHKVGLVQCLPSLFHFSLLVFPADSASGMSVRSLVSLCSGLSADKNR